MIFNETEILQVLPVVDVEVDSDGWRYVTAYIGGSPVEGLDRLSRAIVVALGKRIPLTLRVPCQGLFPKIVWIDQEYVSLDFRPEGFYAVYKRKELGL